MYYSLKYLQYHKVKSIISFILFATLAFLIVLCFMLYNTTNFYISKLDYKNGIHVDFTYEDSINNTDNNEFFTPYIDEMKKMDENIEVYIYDSVTINVPGITSPIELVGFSSEQIDSYVTSGDITIESSSQLKEGYNLIVPDNFLFNSSLNVGDELIFSLSDSLLEQEYYISNLNIISSVSNKILPNTIYTDSHTLSQIVNETNIVPIKKISIVIPNQKVFHKLYKMYNSSIDISAGKFAFTDNLFTEIVSPLMTITNLLTWFTILYSLMLFLYFVVSEYKSYYKRTNEIKIIFYSGVRYKEIIKSAIFETIFTVNLALILGSCLAVLMVPYILNNYQISISNFVYTIPIENLFESISGDIVDLFIQFNIVHCGITLLFVYGINLLIKVIIINNRLKKVVLDV